jgi:xanthine dehydrogenase accessory factor
MIVWRRLAQIVAEHGAAALIGIHEVRGSTPREAGARMIVRPDGAFHGTIGGGQLEWEMLRQAGEALQQGRGPARFVSRRSGPISASAAAGWVSVLVETFDRRDVDALEALARLEGEGAFQVTCSLDRDGRVARLHPSPLVGEGREGGTAFRRNARAANSSAASPLVTIPPSPTLPHKGGEGGLSWHEAYGDALTPVLLFGAGHVGRALVLALAPLSFAVRWIDAREDAFPAHLPANVTPVLTPDPEAEVARASADAMVLVTTHDHALDLAITAAGPAALVSLRRPHRLGHQTRALRAALPRTRHPDDRIAALVCPIGLPGIEGKEPAVIAASVAAQLLLERERGASPQAGRETLKSAHDRALA